MLSDILDGYFPYDLKAKYPEGCPLKAVDCVDETYSEERHSNDARFTDKKAGA